MKNDFFKQMNDSSLGFISCVSAVRRFKAVFNCGSLPNEVFCVFDRDFFVF